MNLLTLPVARWEAWAPGRPTREAWSAWAEGVPVEQDGTPDIKFVDAMLRRRLGPVARMALDVAQRCLEGDRGIPMVFASRHGELARTLGMLQAIAAEEEVSPTAFSLSVHNAAAGVFAIARGDHAPATAIAAGDETLGLAMVEALSRLAGGAGPVLLVYADEPVPVEYARDVPVPELPHALALLLHPNADCRIGLSANAAEALPSGETMSMSFLRLLAGRAQEACWSGERATWCWSRAHA